MDESRGLQSDNVYEPQTKTITKFGLRWITHNYKMYSIFHIWLRKYINQPKESETVFFRE